MDENEVFWLGKRSKSGEERKLFADEPAFVKAMQDACSSHGCEVQRFVSARGPYGTWIVDFHRDGKNQRIVWNGKDEKMVLQVALTSGGWDEPHETKVGEIGIPGFIGGIDRLFGPDSDRDD